MAIGGSNRLLSTAELTELLSVPVRTVQSRWREWELSAFRVGKALRFHERDIEKWLETRRVA